MVQSRNLISASFNSVLIEFGFTAKKAKMNCVAVTTGISSRNRIKNGEPDLIVSSLAEKTSILGFILN